MLNEYEALFARVEKAVDDHPLLCRITDNPILCQATLKVSRLGYAIDILVKRTKSRKRPMEITGHGDTAEEAAVSLIGALDHWAEALK